MTMLSLTSVQVVRQFKTSAEATFAAWLDGAALGGWLFTDEAGAGADAEAEVDARVGHHFKITEHHGDQTTEHLGKYLVIDRPHHLAFSLSTPRHASEHNRVSIGIVEDGCGCTLTLTHAGVHCEQATLVRDRWSRALSALGHHLGGNGQPLGGREAAGAPVPAP